MTDEEKAPEPVASHKVTTWKAIVAGFILMFMAVLMGRLGVSPEQQKVILDQAAPVVSSALDGVGETASSH